MPEPQISSQLRKAVRERANSCCEYCRSQDNFASDSFEVEHSIPRSRGGKNDFENLAWSCGVCNGHKGAKTMGRDLITSELVPLFNPRKQQWDEHFEWSENSSEIIAKTAIGRATINELKLNRQPVVNLRLALIAYGVHPPQ